MPSWCTREPQLRVHGAEVLVVVGVVYMSHGQGNTAAVDKRSMQAASTSRVWRRLMVWSSQPSLTVTSATPSCVSWTGRIAAVDAARLRDSPRLRVPRPLTDWRLADRDTTRSATRYVLTWGHYPGLVEAIVVRIRISGQRRISTQCGRLSVHHRGGHPCRSRVADVDDLLGAADAERGAHRRDPC